MKFLNRIPFPYFLNKLEKFNFFFGICFFFVIFIIFHRGWFFEDGILYGRNWDFSLPDYNILRGKLYDLSRYSYHTHFESQSLLASHLPHNFLYSIIPQFISTSVLNKFILFVSNLFSFLGMFFLLKEYSRKYISFFMAIMYSFSPFFFSIVIAGSWYSWVSYSIAPFFIFFIIKFLYSGKYKFLLCAGIAHIFLIGFLQYYLIVFLITVLWALSIKMNYKIDYCVLVKRILIIFLFFSLLSAYWLFPLTYDFNSFYESTINNNLADNFGDVLFSGQNMLKIFDLTGFLNRHFYSLTFNSNLNYILYTLSAFSVYLIIAINIFSKNAKHKNLFLYLLIFLVLSFLLVKGNNPPFGKLTYYLFSNFSIMQIYRSPQNLYFLVNLTTIILLGLSLNNNYFLYRYKTYTYPVGFILLCFFLSGWILNPDLGSNSLSKKKNGHISLYSANEDIREKFHKNIMDEEINNELFIPLDKSVMFLDGSTGQGNEPNLAYLKNTSPLSRYNSNELNEIFKENVPLFLILFHNIRTISIRYDIADHFKNFSLLDKIKLKNYLKGQYEHIFRSNAVDSFRIPDNIFTPYLTSCQSPEFSYSFNQPTLNDLKNMSIESLKSILCNVIITNENFAINNMKFQAPEALQFTKKSPIETTVLLKGLNKNDNVLIRSAIKSDSNWKLGHFNKKGFINYFFGFREFDKKISNSVQMTGWPYSFNGWAFNVSKYIKNYPTAVTYRKDGLVDIEFKLYYKKQLFFIAGIYLSLLTFFSLFIIVLLKNLKRR